ncbi:hypothetical protein FPJ27_04465 [Burkholderia sp. MS455]|nr:hypothetical protein FPJ27_04465 [Burkholderia sp. MS455]
MDIAARVLRIQQSVQRFAPRGKHRFLITNAGLLRWTQLRNAMSFGEANCGARTLIKHRFRHCCSDVPRCGGARSLRTGAACVADSKPKWKDAHDIHRAADQEAANQHSCFP